MILFKDDLETFQIKNKKDVFNFFLYVNEYSFISQEFVESLREKIETVNLSLPSLYLYLELQYDLYEVSLYPFELLKNAIEKSLKELFVWDTTKTEDEINDYFENQLEIIDLALDGLGIANLIERPYLRLLLGDESSEVFSIFKKNETTLVEFMTKYKTYFSPRKFNKERLFTLKDLNKYQEDEVSYAEVWLLYLSLAYRECQTEKKAVLVIKEAMDEFYETYFKKMAEGKHLDFINHLTVISNNILKDLYKIK